MQRTIIITGASSGFGFHTALKCAEKGFHVIATMRNMSKAEVFKTDRISSVIRERIEIWPLDVTDDNSIEDFKQKLKQLNRVDVLVNNAGFAIGGFLEQVPIEAYRRQFETNVFGVIRTTQAVLPIMRKQGQGKIINVSSISGRIGFPGLSAYVSSKHALEGLTESLRFEVKPFGIDVALIEPGSYQTNIWTSGMELPKAVHDPDSPYAHYVRGLWKALNSESHGAPAKVADLMTRMAGKSQIRKLRYPIGAGVRLNLFLKKVVPWSFLEKTVLKKLLG
ncbi:SDR family oxidoreductase [Halobacillus amylolyticus]|uniref:SDR family oxidoreductase n=1 Tax=Halobacillus amylolyticus TaxID=2932259 RepID=A0ABY4HDU7_9BACI|nr:SDR family oxidoreductase [Halobacillus amylolyticus]UOR13058.1 SDR family oxidoreductase [Halobacillus amylolyticus]